MTKGPLFVSEISIDMKSWRTKTDYYECSKSSRQKTKKHWCAWNSLILANQNTLVDTGLPGLLNFRFHLSMVGFVKNLRLLRVYSIINFAKRYTANIYRDLRGSRRFSLQYLWKRAVRITEKLYTPQRERLCMLWGNPVIFTDCGKLLYLSL